MNYIRYALGIPNNIVNEPSYEKLEQDAALLMRVNELMQHTGQPKPADMDQELYDSGDKGCNTCNLSHLYENLYDAVGGWVMDQSCFSNMGHRRWII